MTFTIKLDTDNEAFGDRPEDEIARILRGIAETLETHDCTGVHETIRDSNGNAVGRFKLTKW